MLFIYREYVGVCMYVEVVERRKLSTGSANAAVVRNGEQIWLTKWMESRTGNQPFYSLRDGKRKTGSDERESDRSLRV